MDNVKEQIKALAEAHTDGIDTVSSAIKDLYMVIDHLTAQLRQSDCAIAAMRHLLVKKGVATSDEIDSLQSKIAEVFNKKQDKVEAKKEEPVVLTMEHELALIHSAAKEAAEDPYDPKAFIFGS